MNNKELSKKLLSLGQELINLSLELDSINNTNRSNSLNNSISPIKTYVWAKKNRFEARYKLPNSTSVKYAGSFETREEAQKVLDVIVQQAYKKVAKV